MAIDDDTPLRLADALALAFPNGGLTVAGLRKEAKRGRLRIERIANKDFTTLGAIRTMRESCRVPAIPAFNRNQGADVRPADDETGRDFAMRDAVQRRLEEQRRKASEAERDFTARDALLVRIRARMGK